MTKLAPGGVQRETGLMLRGEPLCVKIVGDQLVTWPKGRPRDKRFTNLLKAAISGSKIPMEVNS